MNLLEVYGLPKQEPNTLVKQSHILGSGFLKHKNRDETLQAFRKLAYQVEKERKKSPCFLPHKIMGIFLHV